MLVPVSARTRNPGAGLILELEAERFLPVTGEFTAPLCKRVGAEVNRVARRVVVGFS